MAKPTHGQIPCQLARADTPPTAHQSVRDRGRPCLAGNEALRKRWRGGRPGRRAPVHLGDAAADAHPPPDRTGAPVLMACFDLLFLDNERLTGQPYRQRRALLEDLELPAGTFQTVPAAVGEGEAMLAAARQQDLEGCWPSG